MAHFKLNELDEQFLDLPQGAVLVAAGTSGAESWLERDKDATVRLVIATVAVATADAAGLEAVIEVSGADARGEDGPAPADTHLQALQSVQLVVRPGERISFKAYPKARKRQSATDPGLFSGSALRSAASSTTELAPLNLDSPRGNEKCPNQTAGGGLRGHDERARRPCRGIDATPIAAAAKV